ncbi:hypothetical protein KFL_000800100 [Klebsormidium nitens]|uniref:FAD dependent oxidoreductase domain-containing protein n=1 Tax=Klebsormidium nitens TaxID=105231 RepID=A0A1Y1HWT0_KLENI|nr:hypothetical protein KFL_000800100 [Klebsormidium nitens]|eukprot:GAQ81431.1 hypothetical protein KFL_000800100 [Klebsormidium nitens]
MQAACCSAGTIVALALEAPLCAQKQSTMWRALVLRRVLAPSGLHNPHSSRFTPSQFHISISRQKCTAAVQTAEMEPGQERRYAIIGAGFAGVAVTWHLLQHATSASPICIDLFDEVGIAGGASGVAGGLLHAFSNKGTSLWMGQEGYAATLRLLEAAERAQGEAPTAEESLIARRKGILRPAVEQRLADNYKKHAESAPPIDDSHVVGGRAAIVNGETARKLVPGLAEPVGDTALFLPRGITINPTRYLEGLWRACEQQAGDRGPGRPRATLHKQKVDSLAGLSQAGYTAVVICSGAAAVRFPEVACELHLSMCRGRVVELHPPCGTASDAPRVAFPASSPSLLGPAWISAQGTETLLVGATKDWENGDLESGVSPQEGEKVAEELLAKAEVIYPPVREWRVAAVRSGVRAWARRTSDGTVPIAGKIQGRSSEDDPSASMAKDEDNGAPDRLASANSDEGFARDVSNGRGGGERVDSVNEGSGRESSPGACALWVVGGLGARGLVYHAWLAEKAARAVVHDDEALLPPVLRRWQKGFVDAAKAERKPRVRIRNRNKVRGGV